MSYNFYKENVEILDKLLTKFPVSENEEKYLKSKVDLYWTPQDFIRHFRQRIIEKLKYNARYIKT